MNVDKIYLVGFMATGKSTVGRHLAARLRWRFEDIDHLIEVRRVRGRGMDDAGAQDDNGGRVDRDRRFEPGDDRRVNAR